MERKRRKRWRWRQERRTGRPRVFKVVREKVGGQLYSLKEVAEESGWSMHTSWVLDRA